MTRTLRWCRIDREGCPHCHGRVFKQQSAIDDQLASTWGLGRRERAWLDGREGHICLGCGMSRRVRMLMWSLKKICPSLRDLHILHLNQTNELSKALWEVGPLVETIYLPDQPLGAEADGLSNQDMTRLTLADNQFDVVIHSETLEHLHDYEQALSEVHRVLRLGGYQFYSVPLLHHRQTRRRITLDSSGNETHLLPLSAHGREREYPVVWEFGGDFLEKRSDQIDQIHYDNYWKNKTVFTVIERKQ